MSTDSERIPVEPSVLVWARKSISLDVGAAAKRLGVSVNVLESWESGEQRPTIVQLRKTADTYKRPLAVLLLAKPPGGFDAMRDFRSFAAVDDDWSPELHAEFRRALFQREVFLELSQSAPDSIPKTSHPPHIAMGDDPEAVGTRLREFLGVGIQRQLSWSDQWEALNAWVSAVEATGIIVIHTQRVEVSEARGFSISEWPYPVIALNGKEYPHPRVFSLLHELAHLALNADGLCDLHERRRGSPRAEGDEVENFCNRVAAATVFPRSALLAESSIVRSTPDSPWPLEELTALASRYHASAEAFLLRLISLGKASWPTYWLRKPEMNAAYDTAAEERRRRSREGKGGGSFYHNKARDIGHSYASSVLDAFGGQALSSRDVADYLGIKFNQIERLEAVLH